jgi:hypothetical protein
MAMQKGEFFFFLWVAVLGRRDPRAVFANEQFLPPVASFYSMSFLVLVVYVPYWILVGTLHHLIKTKKIEHKSDDDDDDNEIEYDSGGMVLRVVAPLPLATVMASPLTSTSPPGGGAGAAASGHRRAGRWTRGGRGDRRGERRTLPATPVPPPKTMAAG